MSRTYGDAEWKTAEERIIEKHLPKLVPAWVIERRLERELDKFYRDHPTGYFEIPTMSSAKLKTSCTRN